MTFEEFQNTLRVVNPFIPSSGMEGGTTGLIVDAESKILFASKYSGGVVHFLDELFCEDSMVIPKEMIERLIKLSPESTWKGIKKKENKYIMRIGKLTLTFISEPMPQYQLPQFKEEGSAVPKGFFEAVSWAASFMCQDDRKINLHGMQVVKGNLYTCDNVRIVKTKCEVPKELEDVFIPYGCALLVKGSQELSEVLQSKNVIVFLSTSYICYFAQSHAKFPKVDSFLQKAIKEEGTLITIDNTSQDLVHFQDLLFGDLLSVPLEVWIKDNTFWMRTSSFGDFTSSIDLDLPVEGTAEDVKPFYINGKLFVEGLMSFPTFKIQKDSVYFYDDRSDYLVMKMEK